MEYFVVSKYLSPALVSVRVVDGTNVPKPSPVEVVFIGKVWSDRILTMARPPRRPAANPCTCEPYPEAMQLTPEEGEVFGSMIAPEEVTQEQLDARCSAWPQKADAEIGALYGQPAHQLRGSVPRFVLKPIMSANRSGPQLDPLPGALRALVNSAGCTSSSGLTPSSLPEGYGRGP